MPKTLAELSEKEREALFNAHRQSLASHFVTGHDAPEKTEELEKAWWIIAND